MDMSLDYSSSFEVYGSLFRTYLKKFGIRYNEFKNLFNKFQRAKTTNGKIGPVGLSKNENGWVCHLANGSLLILCL